MGLMSETQIGSFPGMAGQEVPRIGARRNPMDKATIISIYPKRLEERKETIQPGLFIIEPGTYENPSITVIEPSTWWQEMPNNQPSIEVPVNSVELAESIIRDYCNGLLACDMVDAVPGMFFVPGVVERGDLIIRYKTALESAKRKQNEWFLRLTRIADNLWARTNGNPLVIWDEMRMAAKVLNMNDKPWIRDYQIIEKIPCKACGTLRDPRFPVCANCKWIDPEHSAAKDIKFAV